MKKRVYIAGPYSKGDIGENINKAVMVADFLVEYGLTPYVPHINHLWHLICPRDYDFWLAYDLEWLKVCHILMCVPGNSFGADREVRIAKQLKLPIYYDAIELIKREGST